MATISDVFRKILSTDLAGDAKTFKPNCLSESTALTLLALLPFQGKLQKILILSGRTILINQSNIQALTYSGRISNLSTYECFSWPGTEYAFLPCLPRFYFARSFQPRPPSTTANIQLYILSKLVLDRKQRLIYTLIVLLSDLAHSSDVERLL